jgi:hypothetical protein
MGLLPGGHEPCHQTLRESVDEMIITPHRHCESVLRRKPETGSLTDDIRLARDEGEQKHAKTRSRLVHRWWSNSRHCSVIGGFRGQTPTSGSTGAAVSEAPSRVQKRMESGMGCGEVGLAWPLQRAGQRSVLYCVRPGNIEPRWWWAGAAHSFLSACEDGGEALTGCTARPLGPESLLRLVSYQAPPGGGPH